MSDIHENRCEGETYRINLEEEYEVREWTRCFRVTETELRSAVQAVGASVAKVRNYLKSNNV